MAENTAETVFFVDDDLIEKLMRGDTSAAASTSQNKRPAESSTLGVAVKLASEGKLDEAIRKLEDAAATLGANRPWVFLTVTLPLALPGIIAGVVLCFARALGEFGATITFVSNIPGETQTISALIYTLTQVPGGDAAAGRLVLIAIVLAFAALFASEWLARRASVRFHGE